MINFREIFDKAADLRTLCQRLVEAATSQDAESVRKYVAEGDGLMSAMVTEIEMDQPRFATDLPDVMDPDGREQVARQMLNQYHDLSVKLKIVQSILNRMEARLGLTHSMTADARKRRDEVHFEREALIWTILELMGVDSQPE